MHRAYTGFSNRNILRNFKALAGNTRIRLYAETVFIPYYVDEAEVMKIAAFIASIDQSIPLRIDAYLPVPGESWRTPEIEELESIKNRARAILPGTTCFHGRHGDEPLVYEVRRIF